MSKDSIESRANDTDTHTKPYHPPHLVIYGDIREITRVNGGTTGMNDGGGGPDKTSP